MARRTTPIQTAMIGGEFSPRLFGRIGIERYQVGLATLENMVIKPGGGAYRLPGTKYLGEVKDSTKSTRVIDFEFSADDALIVEFGDLYARFWGSDGVQIASGGSPVEETHEFAEADLFDVQETQSHDVMLLTHPSYETHVLIRDTATTFTLEAMDTTGHAFSWDDGYAPLSPTKTDESTKLKFTGGTSWTEGEALTLNSTGRWAGTDASVNGRLHKVYRLISDADPTKTCAAIITSRTDDDNLAVTLLEDCPTELQDTLTSLFQEPAFNDDDGYPAAAAFFEERMWFGGTPTYPDTFWGSVTGDFINFNPGTAADDDAVQFTISGGKGQFIEWMTGASELLLGTSKSVHKATGGLEEAITPTRILRREQTRRGCASIDAIRVGYHTIYVQRARHKLRSVTFQDAQGAYLDTDLSAVADHIYRSSRIFNLAFAEERDSIVWASDENGKLAGCTFDPDNDVIAWHRHPDTNGEYESIAVIPQQSFDETWFVVKRTVNGATKRYIERLVEGEVEAANQEDYFYVRSGVTKTGSGFTTFDGLDHLESESVIVLGDGSPQGPFTVSGGAVTLDTGVDKAHAGLAYKSKLKLLPLPTAPTITKGWAELFVRLIDTMSLYIDGKVKGLRKPGDTLGDPIPPVSDDVQVNIEGYDLRGQKEFSTDDPLPMNILMVGGELYTGDS